MPCGKEEVDMSIRWKYVVIAKADRDESYLVGDGITNSKYDTVRAASASVGINLAAIFASCFLELYKEITIQIV